MLINEAYAASIKLYKLNILIVYNL